ncbi:MAG TPA: GGDEF domain-containing protein [Aquabacterium sp.]|nr:GGDEF domain-containing protein [Aquabacterium sp.]
MQADLSLAPFMHEAFDKNERRRRILLRNGALVFLGYTVTQIVTLAAKLLKLSSIQSQEIAFVACLTLGMSALFLLVTQKKRHLSNTYVNLFHFGQYVIWLAMYGIWVLTLREVRVIALFCALMPLTFLLADTKMLQSLVIAISAIVIQIGASHYAIYSLHQVGHFPLEVFYTCCFAPAALFLCYLSHLFSKQRLEIRRAKQAAEMSRDALSVEMGKTQKANGELATALRQIEDLARVDALTGVFNRRHLMACLETAVKRQERTHQVFSIIMVDIDHFKRINDTYGHLAGDAVLKVVAHALTKTLRATDICARYGGEEFVIVLEHTLADQGVHCAERLRALVASAQFEGLPVDFRVTVSLGVTEHLEAEPIECTLERADKALYRAKHGGRNQVTLADAATA